MNGTHVLSISFAHISATQTISCYFRSKTIDLVQLATGSYSDPFADFNLANDTITRQGSRNLAATITSGPNGWYRCSLTFELSVARSFLIYLLTSATAGRNQFNTTAISFRVAAPQLELGSSATGYISRSASVVTRAADVIRDNLNLSAFLLYGTRDFTGPPGAKGLQGLQGYQDPSGADSTVPGPMGVKGDKGAPGIAGATGTQGLQGLQGLQGPPRATGA